MPSKQRRTSSTAQPRKLAKAPVFPIDEARGTRIREARDRRELTLTQTAVLMSEAGDPVDVRTISRWETGREVSSSKARTLAKVLGAHAGYLLFGDETGTAAAIEPQHKAWKAFRRSATYSELARKRPIIIEMLKAAELAGERFTSPDDYIAIAGEIRDRIPRK